MNASVELKPRTEPMQVIVLGLPRTGTSSMKQALQILGYKNVYHMDTVDKDPTHRALWEEALWAKYDESNPRLLGKTELDHLLGEYNATCDMPPALFPAELIAAYPEAKIILTTRDAQMWKRSMQETVIAAYRDPWRKIALAMRIPEVRPPASAFLVNFCYNDFDRFGTRAMLDHNERVRQLAPPDKFLEFEVSSGKWEPLCQLLEKDVPEVPFPRTNEAAQFKGSLQGAYRKIVLIHVGKALLMVAPAIVIATVACLKLFRRR